MDGGMFGQCDCVYETRESPSSSADDRIPRHAHLQVLRFPHNVRVGLLNRRKRRGDALIQ